MRVAAIHRTNFSVTNFHMMCNYVHKQLDKCKKIPNSFNYYCLWVAVKIKI